MADESELIEVSGPEEALEAIAAEADVDPEELRERAENIDIVPTDAEEAAADD